MARKKNGKIKTYIVLALALILVVNGYFRFLHKRTPSPQKKSLSPVPKKAIELATVSIQRPKIFEALGKLPEGLIPSNIRNIFSPLKTHTEKKKKEEDIPEAPPAPPSFNLKGTITGGKTSIAIIDEEFVRLGDWIKGYQVVMIGKKKVRLDSGMEKIVLEILKNE